MRISKRVREIPENADALVEQALLARAVGYRYTEETWERVKDPKTGEYRMVAVKRVHKNMAPNTTAIFFWLKNRCPEKWGNLVLPAATEQDGLLDALDGFAKTGFVGGDDAGEWEVE